MNDLASRISIVVPFFNEDGSLSELNQQITVVMDLLRSDYEIIYVDDGSTDAGYDIIRGLHHQNPRIKVIKFRRNFGKAAALQAGFDLATGDIVVSMDADLQDSPHEIPRFLEKLAEGYDVVSGWKRVRHDPVDKTLPSKLFNWVTRKISGVELHDFNCGFKAYRKYVIEHIDLYGELHRYIPVLAGWKGFRIGEIPVEHRPREHGVSKYGPERILKGLFDLITIFFTRKYERRPLHVFGFMGFISACVGGFALFYLIIIWLVGAGPIGTRPLLFFGMLAVILGVQLVSFGLVAEMLAKAENRQSKSYVVEEVLTDDLGSVMKT
jgi:glycosyltransferase involved in cell wall biosynthesis